MSIKGFLNAKEIIHIGVIVIGWLISSEAGLHFLNYLKEVLPPWMIPVISIMSTAGLFLYKVLVKLDHGMPLDQVNKEETPC